VSLELIFDMKRLDFLSSDGHLLLLGGPGSGKTTLSLVRAKNEITKQEWNKTQRVLFLSFARATIARVVEHLKSNMDQDAHEFFEINTYHGFCWRLLKSHGYLLSNSKKIVALDPAAAAAELAHINMENRIDILKKKFEENGVLGFDLFAFYSGDLLLRSKNIRKLMSAKYPIIIVDEFQDTNCDEWRLIQTLGVDSKIIALADLDQRIYEFRGADPARIEDFSKHFSPKIFDLGIENNRSSGTDIITFGNDLLTGKNKTTTYTNVKIIKYPYYKNISSYYFIKTNTLASIGRMRVLKKKDWSIVILVPTKALMASVSDYLFSDLDKLPIIEHEVAIDHEGPSLAALAIACLLEESGDAKSLSKKFGEKLLIHMRGRTGAPAGKSVIVLTNAIQSYYVNGQLRGAKRTKLVNDIFKIAELRKEYKLTGNPTKDWIAMLDIIRSIDVGNDLKTLLADVRFVRFLTRGTSLRQRLTEAWKNSGTYGEVFSAFKHAIQQEHFIATTRKRTGVNVMTMHKSKGKEFDEVIVYEGYKNGRFVRNPSDQKSIAEARLLLRVAVTRARHMTTLLTPYSNQCIIL